MTGYLIVAALACAGLYWTTRTTRRVDRAPDAVTDMTVSCGNCGADIGNVLGEIRGDRIRVPVAQALAAADGHDCPASTHDPEEN